MNFVLIALCLAAGWSLRTLKLLPVDAHKGINMWILYVALPSVALLYLPAITWSTALILPLVMPVIVWVGAWAVLRLLSNRVGLDAPTRAALLLTAGLGNTSFVGFPLTQAYFGDDGLRIAVICDQLTFIALSTLGVMTAVDAAHRGSASRIKILKNIITFPPFVAFVVSVIAPRFVDITFLNPLLEKLALTLVPLALFSVGMQIQFSDWKGELRHLTIGLAYKLLIGPTLVLLVALLFGMRGIAAQASVFEAAMPPMVSSAILATEYGLNPKLASLMVSVGIVVSIATTAAWWLIIVLMVDG
ncbi:MAG: AEC family transporter [Ignavibacteriae bacterium]|nr:AEC family transporter [Ignavibacteriota bacterium]